MRKTDVLKTLQISLNFKTSCYKSEVWEQNCVSLFYYVNFERNYDVLESKGPCILFNKNINFNKNETELKMENPIQFLIDESLCFSKNRKLKVKLWWFGACNREKKRAFFVPFILSKGNCFNICVLPQCIVYWIHFQNIDTFIYQKTLLLTLFCLFWKLLKAFSVSLRTNMLLHHIKKHWLAIKLHQSKQYITCYNLLLCQRYFIP